MTIDTFTRADLARLASARGQRLVSIYLPTQNAGPGARQNPIRLKNLLRSAEEELAATGMRPTLARDMLAAGYELPEVAEFQPDLGAGLALFFDDSGLTRYRLPVLVPELAVVSDRFDVKPLLPLFTADGPYYLLALSMNRVRAFRGSRFAVHELHIEDMPRSMGDALWPDQPSKQHQFHTIGAGISGRGIALGHSSGDEGADRLKEDIRRYFKMVDNAFLKAVEDESVPLVLAGVDYLHPIYHDASAYRTLLQHGVNGNTDDWQPEDFAAAAWPVVDSYYELAQDADRERFGDFTGTGRSSTVVSEILQAARAGRVETMWVAVGEQRWGLVADGRVVEHDEREAGDDDLFDLAAVETLTRGGKVYAVEPSRAPGDSSIAAIFRY